MLYTSMNFRKDGFVIKGALQYTFSVYLFGNHSISRHDNFIG